MASGTSARLAQGLARRRVRLTNRARNLRLIPSSAGVRFEIPSFREWVIDHPGRIIDAPLSDVPQVLKVLSGDEASHPGMVGLLAQAAQPAMKQRVFCLPGGRLVSQSGLVVTAEGGFVQESVFGPEARTRLFAASQPTERLPRPRRIRESVASLLTESPGNYFHWLFDALPKLRVLDAAGLCQVPLVVPDPSLEFQRGSLELLAPSNELVGFDGTHLQAEELFWPSPAHWTGWPSAATATWLRERIAPGGIHERRIYVSRGNAKRRRIANEAEIEALLVKRGFEVVRAEGLPFRDQVKLFSEAGTIVAPHGAGLSNMVFSAPGARVLELFEPSYLNAAFVALAASCSHHYSYIVGSSHRRGGAIDILLPVDMIEPILDEIGLI